MTPATVGATVSTACIFAGEYVTVSVCSGAQYTFSTCAGGFDTQITLRENTAPFSVLGYNDDACGLQSTVVWTATFTGVIRVLVDRYPCSSNASCHALSVTWDTGCASTGGPGSDCASAIPVNCGNTLTSQTSLGNGNTENNWSCTTLNTPGEDRYYVLNVTDPNATVVRVTLGNVVDTDTYLEVVQAGLTCSGATCNLLAQFDIGAGTFNGTGLNSFDFPVTGAGTWYFIMDSQGDGVSNYDITFECLASGIQWDTSGCAGPPADTDQSGYEVTWNGGPAGTVQHGDVGTVCINLFVTNPSPSGFEWLQTVDFVLGSCWTNATNVTPSGPPPGNGFFNPAGTWTGAYTSATNTVGYSFAHSTNPAWGDGNAPGMTCAMYTFCFQVTVDTTLCAGNLEGGMDIVIFAEDDGVGGFGSTQASSVLALSSEFAVDVSLPVELGSFEARIVDNQTNLAWTTLTETNNDHFRLERSADGTAFENIGTVQGSGNSKEQRAYEFIDAYPRNGENHYRLFQVDRDGEERLIGQEVLYYQGQHAVELLSLGPNPAEDKMYLRVSSDEACPLSLEIRDQLGRRVKAMQAELEHGANTVEVDIASLAPGVYFFRAEGQGLKKTIKVLKTK